MSSFILMILAIAAFAVAKSSKGLVMYAAYIAALILLGAAIHAILSAGLFYIIIALIGIGVVMVAKKQLQKSKR